MQSALAGLVDPQNVEQFKNEIWGKTARVFRGSAERSSLFQKLFTLDVFDRLVEELKQGVLKFGEDILTARYQNGLRERPSEGICNEESLWRLFRSGCTLQFVQPQRFLEALQDICAKLEAELGCLVGSNAYMTPRCTQGLAPHHDDVELFICQTQGRKTWKLYEPIDGFVLPNAPSEDLPQDALGELIMETTLNVGDVLYMPKGIVHQAIAQDEDSVHLTISTYQTWSWGDLTSAVLEETLMAKGEPVCLPASMREGLPLGFLSETGKFTGTEASNKAVAQGLAQRLRDLAAAIEAKPEIVQSAADVMAYTFMTQRMQPSDDCLSSADQPPQLEDRIRVTEKSLSRLMPVRFENGTFDENHIQVITCLYNNPQTHMMQKSAETEEDVPMMSAQAEGHEAQAEMESGSITGNACSSPSEMEDTSSIVFDMQQKEALLQIFRSGEEGVRVRDLHLATDADRLGLSEKLWECMIVQIV